MEGKGGGLLTESNRRRNGSNAEANKAHLGNGTLCRTGNFVPLPIRAPSQSKDQRVEAPPIMSSAVAAFARQRSGSTGVPFLEPPLPVTTRLRPIIRLQRWWRDRRGEFPSFLASLVLHITVIIFVASLMPQPRPGVAVGPLIITLVDEEQSVEDSAPVQIPPSEQEEQAEETDQTAPSPAVPPQAEQKVPSPPSMSSPNDSLDEQVKAVMVAHGKWQISGADAFEQWLKNPEIIPEVDPSSSEVDEPLGEPRSGPHDDSGHYDYYGHWTDFDEIVDRFIDYDIGRLRGLAGQSALRRFQRLGPEAIPALVRGLNKAASIGASCPIVVISRKLDRTLRQTNERSLLRYAIENMGRNVPARAPHAKHVRQLRAKWKHRVKSADVALDR